MPVASDPAPDEQLAPITVAPELAGDVPTGVPDVAASDRAEQGWSRGLRRYPPPAHTNVGGLHRKLRGVLECRGVVGHGLEPGLSRPWDARQRPIASHGIRHRSARSRRSRQAGDPEVARGKHRSGLILAPANPAAAIVKPSDRSRT